MTVSLELYTKWRKNEKKFVEILKSNLILLGITQKFIHFIYKKNHPNQQIPL